MALASGSITPPLPSTTLFRPRPSHPSSSRGPAKSVASNRRPARSVGSCTPPVEFVERSRCPARSTGRRRPAASSDGRRAARRCDEVASNLNEVEKALSAIFLDIHSSDESTIHPANDVLIDALQSFSGNTGDYTSEHYSHMFHWWASKVEKDAEMMCQGEKGRRYMFLLSNTCRVLQIMRHTGASFSNAELVSRLISMLQRYKKCYMAECWVPLNSTHHFNLDEFTAKFFATCDNQKTWKVTAELRYKLREEIVNLVVPPYEAFLSALQANQSQRSGVLCSSEQDIGENKKAKMFTAKELEEEIKMLFEG